MDFKKMYDAVYTYLSNEYNCDKSYLSQDGIYYITATDKAEAFQNPALNIFSMGKSTIISASSNILDTVKKITQGKTREEIFELPFVYGHSIYYIPNKNFFKVSLPTDLPYNIKEYELDDIINLRYLANNFSNAIDFDTLGNTDASIAICAESNHCIIGVAGAAPKNQAIYEIGIDVIDGYRQQGIATHLVTLLTKRLIEKDIVPIYCAASSNIPSQSLAFSCYYRPCWISTYKNILDSSSAYNDILKNLYQDIYPHS